MTAGPIRPDELDAVFQTDERAFGMRMPSGRRAALQAATDVDRVVVSRDGLDIAGVAISVPAPMTLAGPVLEVVPIAAVVGVAVPPTHRRQGRLRSLMDYQLRDLHDRGETVAVLTASEGSIYHRFGYGVATFANRYRIDKARTNVRDELASLPKGRVRFVTRGEARERFPGVLASYQPTRSGEVGRLDVEWDDVIGQDVEEDQRERFFVAYEEDGTLEGYASYRITRFDLNDHRRGVEVVELCSRTASAYLALWAYLLSIDLTGELRTNLRPTDEAVRWALNDQRQLAVARHTDHTWVRLVDVPSALAARTYFGAEGTSITLGVEDPICEWNTGTYRISVGAGGVGSVEPVSGHADIELDVSRLGSVYLGGVTFAALAEAHAVRSVRSGSLEPADEMFVGTRPPFCSTSF